MEDIFIHYFQACAHTHNVNRGSGGKSRGEEASVFLGFISGTLQDHKMSVCISDECGSDFVVPTTSGGFAQVLKECTYMSTKESNTFRGERYKMQVKEHMTPQGWNELCSEERTRFPDKV